MKPQEPIVTTIPESNRSNNCEIIDYIIKTSNLSYRVSPWHGKMKSESKNLVGNLRDKDIFKDAECKNNFEVKKVWREYSVNWNHTDSIINWNQKYSDSIHVDLNHTDSNQPILDD